MSLLEASPVTRTGEIPHGTHNPTLLIPGFIEPDIFLEPAAHILSRNGMTATTSRIGINTGRVVRDVRIAEEHLLRFFEEHGEEGVTLIGHSLGGLYARILAHRNPEVVKGIITVGSPPHQNPIESIRSFKMAGHLMMDMLHRFLGEFVDELKEPIESVEHHLFTPFDLVVNHQEHCEEGPHTHHRVFATDHLSMMVNPLTLRKLLHILPSAKKNTTVDHDLRTGHVR